MKKYKDKKTGAVIYTDSTLGGDWELFETEQDSTDLTGQTDPNAITVPELKSLLTELGVEFDPKAKKDVLLSLYEEHKEQ